MNAVFIMSGWIDSIVSIDSKEISHMSASSKEIDSMNIDRDILHLFPSLDFTRANVYANSKERMKTLLKVLMRVAELGTVTKYDLTKRTPSNGFPRMGGQTAQDVLHELEDLSLLKAIKTTNEKGTLKIERVLTAKGILACLAITGFQKTRKLAKILENPNLKESELAALLKIYNDGYVRRDMDIDRKEFSALSVFVREFGARGFNLELKTEDAILNDLRKTEDEGFNDLMRMSIAEFAGGFMRFMSSTDEESQQEKRDLIFLLNESLKNAQTKTIDLEQGIKFVQGIVNIPTPEFIAWRVAQKRKSINVDWDKAYKELFADVDKKLSEWKVDDITDIGERSEYLSKALQEVAFEQLRKMNS